jgi:hypothetical protein
MFLLFTYIDTIFQVVYDVKKKGMMIPFKGEKNICEELATASQNPDVAADLVKYGVGTHCPIKEVISSSRLFNSDIVFNV